MNVRAATKAANTAHSEGNWPLVPLTEVAEINPRTNKSEIPYDLAVSFVPMPAVGAGDGSIDVSQIRPAGEVKRGYTAFLERDVLFAKITPCMENGKMAVVPKLINGYGFGSTEFHVLRPKANVVAEYLYYYVSSRQFRGEAERQMTGAVGQRRVPVPYLKERTIPLAPLDKQQEIVAEIEKQFSRLDEAVTNLKRVKANLKRYKAAVLKAAVEGRLVETEAELARREGRTYETGEQLLQRILETRRSEWEGQTNYREPVPPDTTDLPALPEGWAWASVQQLADIQLGKMLDRSKNRMGHELPYLRNINVRWNSVNSSDLLTMFFKDSEHERYGLEPGDVLVCEGGEPGRAAIWDGRIPGMMYQKAIHRARLFRGYGQRLFVFFLEFLAMTGRLNRWLTGSTIKHFTRESFKKLPMPLPPINEQDRIVNVVDYLLSLVQDVETQASANLLRAENLRQSILRSPFERQPLNTYPRAK